MRGSVIFQEDHPTHPSAKDADGNTEREPKHGVGEADLSHDLIGHIAVIPDVKFEPKVENTPRSKLQSGDKKRGLQGTEQKIGMWIGVVEAIDEKEGQRTAKSHAPVGMSPPERFNGIIANTACQKKKRKLG